MPGKALICHGILTLSIVYQMKRARVRAPSCCQGQVRLLTTVTHNTHNASIGQDYPFHHLGRVGLGWSGAFSNDLDRLFRRNRTCVVCQGVDNFHLLVSIRDLDGSLPIIVLERLVGTFVEKEVDHLDLSLFDRPVQRGLSVTILVIHVGTNAQQDYRTIDVAIASSKQKGGVALVCFGVHWGIVLDESVHHVDVTLDLHGRVQSCETDVIRGVLASACVFLILHGGELVTHRTLIGIGTIGLVCSHLEAEAALHIKRVLRLRHTVFDLGTTRNEYPADLRETSARGHGERRENTDVKVAVVLALHVLDERVHVVGLDSLHQRLSFPAQPCALSAHAHRRKVLELWQRPRFRSTVAAENMSTHAAVVLADDEGKDKAARLALRNVGVVDPVRPRRRDLAH